MSPKRPRQLRQTGRLAPVPDTAGRPQREASPDPERRDGGRLKDARQQLPTIEQVRKGLPMKALHDLANKLQVERSELAYILGTSLRTLQRKEEASDRLGPAASDRLVRVARILDLATHVFGEPAKASAWLTSKSRALENEIPLYMLDTDIGTERVQQELRQIEFGMPF
jgi:putative toxin-antitoxin system antitoxin component (TIGR02293 family)